MTGVPMELRVPWAMAEPVPHVLGPHDPLRTDNSPRAGLHHLPAITR